MELRDTVSHDIMVRVLEESAAATFPMPQGDYMRKKIAIFPASFDPVTNGHADLINRICNLGVFGELVVAIGVNPAKPARFTLEERTEMLEAIIEPYPQATIDGYTGINGALRADAGRLCHHSWAT